MPHSFSFNMKPIQKLHTINHTLHFGDLMPLEKIVRHFKHVGFQFVIFFYRMVTIVIMFLPHLYILYLVWISLALNLALAL